MSVTFIVQVFLDMSWPNVNLSRQWVEERIDFFHKYTLPSLKNQSFQDFEIFVLCGQKHKSVTMSYPWDKRVKVCYDMGKRRYMSMNTTHVCITRIDSDDMFRKTAMEEVRDNVVLEDKRKCLQWRRNLVWDQETQRIWSYHRPTTPFFTHTFPYKIYSQWKKFSSQHFVPFSEAGGKGKGAKILSQHRVCVIKHHKSRNYSATSPHVRDKLLPQERDLIVTDHDSVLAILKDFGVKEL